jgi:hypothetical protein
MWRFNDKNLYACSLYVYSIPGSGPGFSLTSMFNLKSKTRTA